MSRFLENLSQLECEMKDRYGPSDPLVQEFKQAVASRKVFEARHLTQPHYQRPVGYFVYKTRRNFLQS